MRMPCHEEVVVLDPPQAAISQELLKQSPHCHWATQHTTHRHNLASTHNLPHNAASLAAAACDWLAGGMAACDWLAGAAAAAGEDRVTFC